MDYNLDDFHIEIELRIDWSELNLYGHVSNVEFFNYIQAARIHYLDCIELNDNTHKTSGIGTILASAACQFKKQLFYPGQVKVLSKVDFIKNTSLGLTHLILNEQNEIAGIGQDIIVLFDYNSNTKIQIPESIRTKIEKKEGRPFRIENSI